MDIPSYMQSLANYKTLDEASKDNRSRTNGIWFDGNNYHVFVYKSERSSVSRGPSVIGDSIDAFQSQVDGKLYDSKSAYYEHLKRTGNRIYERGEENANPQQKGDYNNRKELREAVERHWN